MNPLSAIVLHKLTFMFVLITIATRTSNIFAATIEFSQMFPAGFQVSINGGPLTPSGPITVTGLLDDATADIDSGYYYGEFPLTSVTFTGAGFVSRPVTTPLSLAIFESDNFGFQLLGQRNQGVIGWNLSTASGSFMTNVNDLSTLIALPYTTTGRSTFWYDALGENSWTLEGGDTIGANRPHSGPAGTFSITLVPEPSTYALAAIGVIALLAFRRRRR